MILNQTEDPQGQRKTQSLILQRGKEATEMTSMILRLMRVKRTNWSETYLPVELQLMQIKEVILVHITWICSKLIQSM